MKFFKQLSVLPLLASLCFATEAAAVPACSFSALPIETTNAERATQYRGSGKKIEVAFDNEEFEKPVESFPESKMKIRSIDKGLTCEIDGGIWVRGAVYLSADESTVIAKQFSGSNEQLNFYNTKTCARKGSIDVSNRLWVLDKNRLTIGSNCTSELTSCVKKTDYRWTNDCRAQRQMNNRSGSKK